MAAMKLDIPDAPACPLLGLAGDRRSRFTFPHQGHRCFSTQRPVSIDAGRQAGYCLDRAYVSCDRYQAWLTTMRPRESDPAALPDGAVQAVAPGSTVIHIVRGRDSLAGIAAKYGLTPEQLAAANGLPGGATVVAGLRLEIPLQGRPSERSQAGSPRPRADRSS